MYLFNYERFKVLTFLNTEHHTCWFFLSSCSMWASQKMYTQFINLYVRTLSGQILSHCFVALLSVSNVRNVHHRFQYTVESKVP